jgi:hypothetical protein
VRWTRYNSPHRLYAATASHQAMLETGLPLEDVKRSLRCTFSRFGALAWFGHALCSMSNHSHSRCCTDVLANVSS